MVKVNLHNNGKNVLICFYINELNLGWIFDNTGFRPSDTFFRFDQHFVMSMLRTSYKYIVPSGRGMAMAISEIVGNFDLISSQNSLNEIL